MVPGEVIVFVLGARGKPGVSTMHLSCDTEKVRAATSDVGIVQNSMAGIQGGGSRYRDARRSWR